MNSIFFSQVIFVDQSHCVAILARQLALTRSPFMFFHEVYTENNATIATDQIVEVFTSSHAHVVYIGAD